jgi:catechol 2,3-dioxygenase
MPRPALPDRVAMGPVGLAVADLDRSRRFYLDRLGLEEVDRDAGAVRVGAGGRVLLELVERPGAVRDPEEAGLFHVALLVPDRPALGRVLRRLARDGTRLTGAADHVVSEAVYLDDPDGHGLELYADRPREAWFGPDGRFLIDNLPLDAPGIMAGAEGPGGLPAGTVVGHVHLEAHDMAAARAFYAGALGFAVMAEWPKALFMSKGGYHHHLAANTWNRRRKPATDRPDRIGLLHYTIALGSGGALRALGEVIPGAGSVDGGLEVADPSGLRVRLVGGSAGG